MPTRCPPPALLRSVIIPLLRTTAARIAAVTAATVITAHTANRLSPAPKGLRLNSRSCFSVIFCRGKFALAKRSLWSRSRKIFCEWNLLDEQRFPKLISAHEGLHRAESVEQVLNLAVLVNPLRGAQYRCRNDLQRIRIRDPVALKTFRLLAVE